ncbi:hypothetical protein Fcan01_24424 [Folsomia candida]|uniref:Uncharacterized protein n=1 Tax=Folsomia candida TaxID=158441 RepID=A0A226D7M0_FOLCA|nr:hypothetical protein Fcan01_24424 [Folsomia candida]
MDTMDRIISFVTDLFGDWISYTKTLYLVTHKEARYSSSYIESCLQSYRMALTCSLLPFRYDENAKSISLKPFPKWAANLHFALQIVILVLHLAMGFHWNNTIGKGVGLDKAGRKELTWKKIVQFYYYTLSGFTLVIIILFRLRADRVKPLLTIPFHMEIKWCQGREGYVTNVLLGLTACVTGTCLLLPFMYLAASLLRPCLPFLSVSLVTKSCPTWASLGEVNLGAQIFFALVEYYYWIFILGLALGIGWIALVYPGIAAKLRIDAIMRELKIGIENGIVGFREIQVLQGLTNSFWKFPLMQIMLGAWLVCEVIALYSVVRLAGTLPLPIFIYFSLISIDGAALIHVHFKLLAVPCIASIEMFEYRKKMPRGGSRWFRRVVKSCSPYQLKMADGRFFDKKTALVIWQFVVDRVVMCLIM